MKAKTFIPLIAGLGIGFVAIRMGRDMLQRAEGSSGPGIGVVIAAGSIDPAAAVTAQCLALSKVPSALIPRGAFADPKALVGRVAKALIPQGVMITEQMLAPPGTQPGLSSRIPDGYRAVAVKVDEASSVGGFITPGSHVDVSAVMTERFGSRDRTSSRIILQNVCVGAVGQSLNSMGPDGKTSQLSRSVTLLLKPDDVPKLQMASAKGLIHLAMRNGRDEEDGGALAKSLLTALLSRPSKPAPAPKVHLPPPPPAPRVVEVYRGTQYERVAFGPGGSTRMAGGAPGDPPPDPAASPQPSHGRPAENGPAQEVAE
ncbi:MAG: Flp pilus assembly protein CpaB [Phycisphaerae bacterium]